MGKISLLTAMALLGSTQATNIEIDTSKNFGSWEGFGVSLAWWANAWGGSQYAASLADAGFTLNNVSLPWLGNQTVPGLGMTIARYNVGGSSNTSYNGASIVYSPNIPWWKQIQAFWLDWQSNDPSSPSFDWSRDANQVNMLKLAAQRAGSDARFEIFSNTPVWWMLNNHNPSGAADGSNNLQPWNYANHSYYMAAVAAHARDVWGVEFASIELFNEPASGWWKSDGTQEGCHFDPATQATVLGTLPAALDRFSLSGQIRVAASDENAVDLALSTWTSFNASVQRVVDQVNVHGYEEGGDRAGLYNAAVVQSGKVLRDSEYGDGDGSGATLAQSFLADWASLHPRGWCYWQLLDVASGWALIQMDMNAIQLGAVNTKYYAIAQLSRHIRPGMLILTSDDGRNATAVAYDDAGKALTIVTSNPSSSPVTVTFDLTGFSSVAPGPIAGQWSTDLSSMTPNPKGAYTPVSGASVTAGKLLTVTVPANTLTTCVIAGVSL